MFSTKQHINSKGHSHLQDNKVHPVEAKSDTLPQAEDAQLERRDLRQEDNATTTRHLVLQNDDFIRAEAEGANLFVNTSFQSKSNITKVRSRSETKPKRYSDAKVESGAKAKKYSYVEPQIQIRGPADIKRQMRLLTEYIKIQHDTFLPAEEEKFNVFLAVESFIIMSDVDMEDMMGSRQDKVITEYDLQCVKKAKNMFEKIRHKAAEFISQMDEFRALRIDALETIQIIQQSAKYMFNFLMQKRESGSENNEKINEMLAIYHDILFGASKEGVPLVETTAHKLRGSMNSSNKEWRDYKRKFFIRGPNTMREVQENFIIHKLTNLEESCLTDEEYKNSMFAIYDKYNLLYRTTLNMRNKYYYKIFDKVITESKLALPDLQNLHTGASIVYFINGHFNKK